MMRCANALRTAVGFWLLLLPVSVPSSAEAIPDRWLERSGGYDEGRELQRLHQADMVLFIASRSPAGPARRSREFENDVLRHQDARAFLRNYVKVKLTIPADPETNQLADERFRVQYGPRVFVVRPNGFATPIRIHLGEGDQRSLLPVDDILRRIAVAGTPQKAPADPRKTNR